VATGYRGAPNPESLAHVNRPREIHFVTRTGLLCGANATEPFTALERWVTCAGCSSLLRVRERERREAVKRAVTALTRIMKEE
jgi:hypothetical protein